MCAIKKKKRSLEKLFIIGQIRWIQASALFLVDSSLSFEKCLPVLLPFLKYHKIDTQF